MMVCVCCMNIPCHNLESLRVLLPSNISTGNVNLNKKPPKKKGTLDSIFYLTLSDMACPPERGPEVCYMVLTNFIKEAGYAQERLSTRRNHFQAA